MKNKISSLLLLCFISVLFFSCSKKDPWDDKLNGSWKEVTVFNAKSLLGNCNLYFENGLMTICDKSITDNLGKNSNVHAEDGQIWIDYQLSFRTHMEYRYDYSFDGDYLLITEETTSDYLGLPKGSSLIKKYERN